MPSQSKKVVTVKPETVWYMHDIEDDGITEPVIVVLLPASAKAINRRRDIFDKAAPIHDQIRAILVKDFDKPPEETVRAVQLLQAKLASLGEIEDPRPTHLTIGGVNHARDCAAMPWLLRDRVWRYIAGSEFVPPYLDLVLQKSKYR